MIVVVDLDGTLLNVNSFPLWILHVIKQSVKKIDVIVCAQFLILLLLRKMGFMTHRNFKMRLMRIDYTSDYNDSFARSLLEYVNNELLQELGKHNKATFVLSTAAPENYVKPLSNLLELGFQYIHASKVISGDLFENYGNNKVLSFRESFGDTECDIFFTDHYEDIPMMHYAKNVILVNPSEKTKLCVLKEKIEVNILL